jgi:hypothetical protein
MHKRLVSKGHVAILRLYIVLCNDAVSLVEVIVINWLDWRGLYQTPSSKYLEMHTGLRKIIVHEMCSIYFM